jgi:hypothetical protein
MPSISGSVNLDGIGIGSVTGTYIDDSVEQRSETINNVTINITVYIDSTVIGSGVLQYQDYVAYDGGGSRTINVSGNTLLDSTVVGSAVGYLIDNYSAVVSPPPPPPPPPPPTPPPTPTPTPTTTPTTTEYYALAVPLVLLLLLLAVSRRRRPQAY